MQFQMIGQLGMVLANRVNGSDDGVADTLADLLPIVVGLAVAATETGRSLEFVGDLLNLGLQQFFLTLVIVLLRLRKPIL